MPAPPPAGIGGGCPNRATPVPMSVGLRLDLGCGYEGRGMRVRLLGGFGVEVGGESVDPARWRLRKARTVVKLLCLERDQRLHREFLLHLLWPDLAPSAASNNLHQALHVARRALAAEGTDGLLELRDQLVVLRADGLVEVDAERFRSLARTALDGEDLAALRAADAAYRGELLPEDRFEPWAGGPRDELHALHRDVLVSLGRRLRADGLLTEAETALERALERDPLHESALRLLLRVLADNGRRSAALLRFERARTEMRSAYGSDPDPETRRLYRELLVGSADTEPRAGAPVEVRHNIPARVTSFVGRAREVAEVRRLLSRTRLLTLTGPGGAGKTRLAQEAARAEAPAVPGGAWHVDLIPIADRHLVADTIAVALGLPPAAGGDPLQALTSQLGRRRILVVLDNCEHLLAECARVAEALRARCPGVSVLATSREPLHVDGEVVLRVPSLALPAQGVELDHQALADLASIRLFIDRTLDIRPDFGLDAGNSAAVVDICRRLDGMPLAIELAAARMAHLEPAEIASRLGDAMSVLGRPGSANRHATLRATLEWSHDLLTPEEQCLLRRLAVFQGGCDLDAVERVVDGNPLATAAVLDVLGRLVDKSLVQVDRDGGRSRYRLLETVRQLAAERLDHAGETRRVRDAHAAYFRELARRHDPDLATGVVVERATLLDIEHDNLRAALMHSLQTEPGDALDLTVSLWRFWMTRGHYLEGADWLRRAIDAAPERYPARADALRGLAMLEIRLGDGRRAAELDGQAMALPEVLTAPEPEVVFGRLLSGFLSWCRCDLATATEVAEESATAAARLGRPEIEATAHWLAGVTALFQEDLDRAEGELDECRDRLTRLATDLRPFFPCVSAAMSPMAVAGRGWIPVFEETMLQGRRVGAGQAVGYVQSLLGSVHRFALRPEAAEEPVRSAVRTFRSLGDPAGLAMALNHLGCVERDTGGPDAVEHLNEALRLREQLGDRRAVTVTLAARGLAETAAGDHDRGRRSVQAALAQLEAINDGAGAPGLVVDLAVVELVAGEPHAASVLAANAAELYRPQGFHRLEALTQTLAARLAGREGDQATAYRYAEEARRLFADFGCRPGEQRAAGMLTATAKSR
jgi:predicted ATPase/DNA-binding SARP family transcriptional activator